MHNKLGGDEGRNAAYKGREIVLHSTSANLGKAIFIIVVIVVVITNLIIIIIIVCGWVSVL